MPQMFSERDLEVVRAPPARLRPGRAREPRQGPADAAPVRRGAGPVPRPSAREDRRCRASLASRRQPTSSRAANAEGRRVRIGEELTTKGSTAILEYEPGDLTCVVEAGVRLSALHAALAEHGQRLSLDPPGDPTIGACLAANLSGPLRHRFGAPRDLVLGVTLVLADGTIANAGGKVVKNVAGYDLGKLVCGSRGTLGLIARVSLRLHPLPAATRHARRRDRRPRDRRRAAARARNSCRARSTCSTRAVSPSCSRAARRAVAWQLDAARALVGGEEDDGRSLGRGTEPPGRRPRAGCSSPPGELAALLAGLDEADRAPGRRRRVRRSTRSRRTCLAALRQLHERIRLAFDPNGILSPAT